MEQAKPRRFFNSLPFYISQALLFLIPIFFIPSLSVPFDTAKSSLIIILSVVLLFVFIIGRLNDGSFSYPKNWFYGSALLVLITYSLASFFSGNADMAIFGLNLETGTLSFVASCLALFLAIPLVFTNEEKIFYSYLSLFISFFVVAFYQLLHLLFPKAFSFIIFTSNTANLVGSWNDLGVFFGLSAILSMITLENISLSKSTKTFLYICFAASLLFLMVINFSLAWFVLAFFSLAFFLYQNSFRGNDAKKRFPATSLIALILSVIFIFSGSSIGTYISNITQISQVEVRPSWSSTFDIAQTTLKEHLLFGSGPNRFVSEWLSHKPEGINNTIFWNTNFNYGIGFIPTLPVTIGLLGTIGFLVFLILFLYKGALSLFVSAKSPFGSYLLTSTFVGALYLWIFTVIYVPNEVILALTFIFSGLFVAALISQDALKMQTFSFASNPVKNFISVLLSVLLLISLAAYGYGIAKKILASVYFQNGSVILSQVGDLNKSEEMIIKAFAFYPNALYSRAIAEINLVRLNNLLNSTTTSQTEAQRQFQIIFAKAVGAAQESATLDPSDYQNYLELAKIYGSVVALKIPGAYEAAKTAYGQALALNPHNPEIYFLLAQLDLVQGDNEAAIKNVNSAITEKSDYADAIYLLSQIYVSQNKIPEAINAVKALAQLSPNNPGIFFELGLLYYNQKNYASAADALSQALYISPDYANAKYFLGLSDYYIGNKKEAIVLFSDLAKTNSDNVNVTSVLNNLLAGRLPFATSKSNSKTLPVAQ